jgi:hypothetical protein
VYRGNEEEQRLLVGFGETIGVGVSGADVFDRHERTGTQYAGLTGVKAGASADQGTGYDFLVRSTRSSARTR